MQHRMVRSRFRYREAPAMRIAIAALIGLASCAAPAVAAENPYVLKLDKARYVLRVPTAGASAAAGATREDFRATPSVAPIVSGEAQRWRMREQDYELRLADLRREKEAWRQRAEMLESELRFYLSTTPTPLRGR
jgi:hypothetical protein